MVAAGAGHVHMVGVCGVGMAGLAYTLKARGFRVSGCDVTPGPLRTWLQSAGIHVAEGHSASHGDPSVDWLIRSTAVPTTSEEVQAAKGRGIPVFRRGDVLPVLIEQGLSIAVTGTHGKTTTSGLIAQILRATGTARGWCIGGEVDALGGVAGHEGTEGYIVVEADESDGTAANYHPDVAVVTNVEFDHMEHFASVEDFQDCFRTFISNTKKHVIYNADDAVASSLSQPVAGAVSFGFSDEADYQCQAYVGGERGSTFEILHDDACVPISLPFFGRHNVLNATCAFCVCREIGVDADRIVKALAHAELPRRRLQRLAESAGIRVVSDYAHHPSEIRCAVSALRADWPGRIVAVFQPHRYTRTRALGADFPAAFKGVDVLVLPPVYAASESPLPGGGEWDLYARFRAAASDDADIPVPMLVSSLAEAWHFLEQSLRPGDLLAVLGAGDVETLAFRARDALHSAGPFPGRPFDQYLKNLQLSDDSAIRLVEPLAGKTTLGVGGAADVWVEPGSVEDFRRTLKWAARHEVPFTLVGGGSNLLVSDAGIRGVVCRLKGAAFKTLRIQDEHVLVVGAAVVLADVLDWMEARSLTGLTFLQGIPGTLGGGMHMNAGAWRQSLGDHVLWVRCLNSEGNEEMVDRAELQLGYRHCGYLQNRYVIEAAFQVQPGNPESIRAEREEIRQKRAWMAGYRSAGSAFKNPVDDHAGRLLEKAGMRGVQIGGAKVYEGHGNFITAQDGATASDVRALICTGRSAVRHAFGIELETEVRILF